MCRRPTTPSSASAPIARATCRLPPPRQPHSPRPACLSRWCSAPSRAERTSSSRSPRPTKPPPSVASPRRRLGRWRKDDRRSASRRYDHLDQRCETLEIGGIEGQQPALAMRQHRCDDVGVMDLTAAKGEATAQLDELVPDRRTVFKNLEIAGDN